MHAVGETGWFEGQANMRRNMQAYHIPCKLIILPRTLDGTGRAGQIPTAINI